jgi:hypothetical protein
MNALPRAALLLLLVLAPVVRAGAEPVVIPAPTAAPVPVGEAAEPPASPAILTAAPPSKLFAMLRAGAATSAVALLLVGAMLGYRRLVAGAGRARRPPRPAAPRRWWQRWLPARPAEADRIEVLSRTHLGTRESLGVVRIGRERLLVGVTPGQISLLTRLEPAQPVAAAAPADDFPAALAAVEVAVPRTPDELRRALARSRERLERLSGRRVTDKGPRG